MRSSIVCYGCSRAFSRFTLPSAGLAAVGLLETGQDLNISPGQCQQPPRPGSPSVSPQSSGVSVIGVPQPCALPAGAAGGLGWRPGAMLGAVLPTRPPDPAPAPCSPLRHCGCAGIDTPCLLPAGLVLSQQPYLGIGNSPLFILMMKIILWCEKVPGKFPRRQLLVEAVFYSMPFTSIAVLGRLAGCKYSHRCLLLA